jgi:hypothetical protein
MRVYITIMLLFSIVNILIQTKQNIKVDNRYLYRQIRATLIVICAYIIALIFVWKI